jgi:WhiB family redox-sensing transcriptional regulator
MSAVVTALDMLRPAWMARAACADAPRDVFYPPRSAGRGAYSQALSFCGSCEVRDQCLAWALAAEGTGKKAHRHGMFGGLTPSQRAAIRPPQVCEVCGIEFRYEARTPTCSKRCWRIRKTRQQTDWLRKKRNRMGPRGQHGSTNRVNAGCKCAACSGRRRSLRRLERMRANVRERAAS